MVWWIVFTLCVLYTLSFPSFIFVCFLLCPALYCVLFSCFRCPSLRAGLSHVCFSVLCLLMSAGCFLSCTLYVLFVSLFCPMSLYSWPLSFGLVFQSCFLCPVHFLCPHSPYPLLWLSLPLCFRSILIHRFYSLPLSNFIFSLVSFLPDCCRSCPVS